MAETYKDRYGRELVYKIQNGTIPNRAERRKHGIRRPLHLIQQHRDLLESLVEVADEGAAEIEAREADDEQRNGESSLG